MAEYPRLGAVPTSPQPDRGDGFGRTRTRAAYDEAMAPVQKAYDEAKSAAGKAYDEAVAPGPQGLP